MAVDEWRSYRRPASPPYALNPRDNLISDAEPSHLPVDSAEAGNRYLVIDEFELANSTRNRLG